MESMKTAFASLTGIARERAVLTYLEHQQEELLFHRSEQEPGIKEPKAYAARFPHLAEFEQDILEVEDGTRLGLWVRKADHADAPVYVVFSGRHGHWARAGLNSVQDEPGYDSGYRLAWLNAIAETGAGVIAVHTRGHGLSRGSDTQMGERYFKKDMRAVADHLKEKGIPGNRVIVAGDSMGGALAAMFAEEMNGRNDPPSVLGLIVSFANMTDAGLHNLAREGHLLLPDKQAEPDKHQSERERLWKEIHQRLKQKGNLFDTAARIGHLNPERTTLCIFNAETDYAIPPDQMEKLRAAGMARGLEVRALPLKGEYVREDCVDPHINWNPATIARNFNKAYQDRQKPSYARETVLEMPGRKATVLDMSRGQSNGPLLQ